MVVVTADVVTRSAIACIEKNLQGLLMQCCSEALPLLLAADAALKNNRSQVIDLMANEVCDDG